jgi:hypothetical protein
VANSWILPIPIPVSAGASLTDAVNRGLSAVFGGNNIPTDSEVTLAVSLIFEAGSRRFFNSFAIYPTDYRYSSIADLSAVIAAGYKSWVRGGKSLAETTRPEFKPRLHIAVRVSDQSSGVADPVRLVLDVDALEIDLAVVSI